MAIADHIWDAFEEMAQQMGADRDGLVNQAMFMFARLNGFLMANNLAAAAVPVPAAQAAANGARAQVAAAPAPARPGPPVASAPQRAAAPAPRLARPPPPEPEEDPARREVAERVLETAAELERLIKGKNNPVEEEQVDEEPPPEDVDDGMGDMDVAEDQQAEDEAPAEEEEEGGALYLMNDNGEMEKIAKERFVIGRGKHCDFVINSGKVSREHAVIVREGADFFIEDLGSSNGTWYNKQRIKRRKVEDGDEYFICSEKVKLVMR